MLRRYGASRYPLLWKANAKNHLALQFPYRYYRVYLKTDRTTYIGFNKTNITYMVVMKFILERTTQNC